jgi:ribosomal-protein-alanine N-acetyltransferase
MIVELTNENEELKNSFNSLFSTIFSYDINDDFKNNSFSKYFIYMENCSIIAFVNFYDLYERFEIANIYVLEDFRRKGIASTLLEKVIVTGEEKEIENITLEVRQDNTSAIMLYEKFKFIPVATRSKYYNGVDGILMERMMK